MQPTLGRQVAALEAILGRTLSTRATDGLRPTDLVLDLLPHAEAMAAAAGVLLRTATARAGEPTGLVRLAASDFIGGAVLSPMLARFRAAWPRVEVDLAASDRTDDLLRREADLAVRNVRPTQAALVGRRLGEAAVGLFAHRDYAALHGLPDTVAGLRDHAMVGRADHAGLARAVLGETPRLALRCAGDLGVLLAIRAGVGIGYCQLGVGRRDPDLVPVLPDLVLARVPVWIVMHGDLRSTGRVRLLFDHLAEEMRCYLAGEV